MAVSGHIGETAREIDRDAGQEHWLVKGHPVYTEEHGHRFGRIELIDRVEGQLRRAPRPIGVAGSQGDHLSSITRMS